MSASSEQKDPDSKLDPKQNQQPSRVKFDLGLTQLVKDFPKSSDGIIQSPESSELSKASSSSSIDSIINTINNSSVVNTRTPFGYDTESGNKSTLRRYAR